MSILSYVFPRLLYSGSSIFNKKVEVIESFGRVQLVVNGIVQTGAYTQKLFHNGLQKLAHWHKGKMRNILVLGVGGGGVFSDLHNRYPDAKITGVDIDAQIIDCSKKYFGTTSIPNVTLVCRSAEDFIKNCRDTQLFDCILVDIYTGNDVPEFVTNMAFVRSMSEIVRDGGSVMINYFSLVNQKEKSHTFMEMLSKVFCSVQGEDNYRNIFFYCRK